MRYADQIVGVLIVIALLSLIAVIFLLGSAQRWFSKKYSYITYAATATGLSRNMNVLFMGVPIGNIKDFKLINKDNKNQIEVTFTINNEYKNLVRDGTLVEVIASPIGLGDKFFLYSGNGEEKNEGDFVPMINSPEGKLLKENTSLSNVPPKDDFIADTVDQVQKLIADLQVTLAGLNAKTDERSATALGQTLVNIEHLTSDLASYIANPEGAARRVLNGDGNTISGLENTIVSLSGTMNHLEDSLKGLPNQMPQIYSLINNARNAISGVNDVVVSFKNNPILKGGIPDKAEIDSSGTNPRNIKF
jgi:phospholipid/cholesterol/gamma-HCH transport system substrate-binding protein